MSAPTLRPEAPVIGAGPRVPGAGARLFSDPRNSTKALPSLAISVCCKPVI